MTKTNFKAQCSFYEKIFNLNLNIGNYFINLIAFI